MEPRKIVLMDLFAGKNRDRHREQTCGNMVGKERQDELRY